MKKLGCTLNAALLVCLPPSITAAPPTVLVEAYGDSTTLGAITINNQLTLTKRNQPTFLEQALQEQFGKAVIVDNKGIGGTEAAQLLNGLAGFMPWHVSMLESKADIVILNFALNDMRLKQQPEPGVPSVPPEEYAQVMRSLILTARKAGKFVVLEEPNPTCFQPKVGQIQQYVAALRSVATETKTPLVPAFDKIQAMDNWKSLFSDCVHPKEELYKIKGRNTADVLKPIVGRLMGITQH